MLHFPISGVETWWWLPVAVAFGVSCFASLGGLSGAFLLLPFQVSALGFTGPAVTPTNLVFNVVAIPVGLYRYIREKQMVWPLTTVLVLGSAPGTLIGAIIRTKYLLDPAKFKLFVGLVLLYIGSRLVMDVVRGTRSDSPKRSSSTRFEVENARLRLAKISYTFNGEDYSVSSFGVFTLSLIVGIIGGAYGIGGGAIIAPFLVTVFKLPVHSIPAAALFATFVSSVAGVISYTVIGSYFASAELSVAPDWLLGAMFGAGGLAGIYTGARMQKVVPARVIKGILAFCIFIVVVKYLGGYIFK